MDKKTIIGLVLMVAVFVGFSFYQSHEAKKYEEYRREVAKEQQEKMVARATEEEAARLAEENMTEEERMRHLDKTLVMSFDMTISALLSEGRIISRDTISARNDLLATIA